MNLNNLLTGVETLIFNDSTFEGKDVENITFDSRNVNASSVFIALKGETADGHDYIESIASIKPVAIVAEHFPENISAFKDTVLIKVPDSHKALGIIASNFYGNPSEELTVIGVTGTNGKTTIATLLYKIAGLLGIKAGLLSTVANYIGEDRYESTHTTPDSISLNRLLRQMADEGCSFVAMEVSSHAAHQKRIAGLNFSGGIFTNLSRDHLDYHKDLLSYRDAKKSFFDNLPSESFALVNSDDSNGTVMLQNTKARHYTYSLSGTSDFKCSIVEQYIDNTQLRLNRRDVTTLLTGKFNAYNVTAVFGCMMLLGLEEDKVLKAISLLEPVKGRFQTFRNAKGKTVIVDYAHTPDALMNVLKTIGEVRKAGQKIITVFGAGGNRDKGKRSIMGEIAGRYSDKIIITSDNPRFEDPNNIISDIMKGVLPENIQNAITISDRREAIHTAVALSGDNDIILIAGKGHENYQDVKGVKYHFDDSEEVIKALSN